MLRFLRTASIVVAGGTLAAGYALAGQLAWSALIAAAAAGWLVLGRRGAARSSDLVLIAGSSAATVGILVGAGAAWMVLGLVAILTAWDLEGLARWLEDGVSPAEAAALQRSHLQRLLAVDLLGLGLALLALQLRVRLRLGLLVLAGLVLAVGLSQVVRLLRRQAD